MMKTYFDELEKRQLDGSNIGKANFRKIHSLEIARLGKRLCSGENKVAWCGLAAPFDLLNALGVTSCFVEFIGAILAFSGTVGSFIEATDQIGLSSDVCSYHRAITGAVMTGKMPKPEFLVGTTCPCTGGLAVIDNMAREFDKKLFVLNIPQSDTGYNVAFLSDQIRDLVRFTEGITGKPLDKGDLKKAIECTNRAREILIEVYNLARNVPSPIASRDLANFGLVLPLFFGKEEAVKVIEACRSELWKRVTTTPVTAGSEKFRLMWIQNRIQFRHPLEKLLEEKYGAKIVVDELNDITWDAIDPDDPYDGLALRSISIPLNGPIERRVEHMKKLASEYKIHGAINPCNWGCRQGTGARGLIEEGLKEIGIPVLNLEVDCCDSRKFTLGQFQTRIEAFMEMMDSRPSPWY